MRNLVFGLAALACVTVPAVAMGQDDIIGKLFTKADEIYKDKGYRPTGWQQRGALAQGAASVFKIDLKGGKAYSIVGMCDTNCENLDMVVLDGNGREVGSDLEKDDFPIVAVDRSGTYTIRLTMVACSSSACNIGAKSFVQ